MRIGLFVDVANLYHCIAKRYDGKRLDYGKYLEYIESNIGAPIKSIAYGIQEDEEAIGFITCLKKLGYIPKFKKPRMVKAGVRKADWDVGIVLDIVDHIKEFDLIILGSADGDFVPLISWIRRQGVEVRILACKISQHLSDICDHDEITEDMLI